MKRTIFSILVLFVFAGFLLSACGGELPVTGEEAKPVQLEPIAGTDLNRITLTEKAAERLDIQTASVHEADVSGAKRVVIPYAAVLYEANGNTWVYVNIEPRIFVRQPIVIDSIKGDEAILSEGPDSGSAVVTVGAAELFGSESEFEEE